MSGNSPAWMSKWAHDLRGPLAPIQSALFLLRHGSAEGGERDELFDLVDRQIRRLTGMIDEIGDWVRADQGRLLTRRGPIDLALLIEASRGIGAAAVDVRYIDGADNVSLEGDASRLASLLTTFFWLVSTSPEEAATPSAATVQVADGRVRLRGRLNPAVLAGSSVDNLFSEPQPAPMGDGLGLRLLIAHAVATGHGGELRVQSRDDDGADVELHLPVVPTRD